MSSGAAGLESAEAAKANMPGIEKGLVNEEIPANFKGDLVSSDSDAGSSILRGPNGEEYPTAEEIKTLPRTHGPIPWIIYSIAFVELCERFAYYGTIVVFVNFIQWPLPPNAEEFGNTGAAGTFEQPGALGLGQRASTALTLFNSFWSYIMPMLGGYLADTYWGRYKTIQWAIVVAIVGHIILIISAIPSVITNPNASLGIFVVGLVFFGIGVGWFKCNISPLIAEQYERDHPRLEIMTTKTGERVILDPTLTISRIYMRYYWMINVGALIGQISMVYAEKYVGFWLSYFLPTIMFFFCPIVMVVCRKQYVRRPPTGSVLSKSMKLLSRGFKQSKSINPMQMRTDSFWESVRPSRIPESEKPAWMTFDDAWVDEVRRGFKACTVFLWFPIFWLSYSQMTNNMVSQAGTMQLGGVPNDIVNNLNPLALLILIPIFDKFVYPNLARMGIRFTPIKKITLGFFTGASSMVVAAVIQHFIYTRSPCGTNASDAECIQELGPPPISVWVQAPAYILVSLAEIFASIVGLEYAFTKAPKNMRSLVTGVFWFAQAFSSAIAQAFVGLAADPLLVWLYTTIACISALGGVGFWFTFAKLDREEDQLNALPESTYKGRHEGDFDAEEARAEMERQDRIRKVQGMAGAAQPEGKELN